MDTIRVATLNLRNTSDRWKERAPLLIEQLVDLRPDVIGLQEVRVPADQARWIVERANERVREGDAYAFFQANKTGLAGMVEGIAVMTCLPMDGQEWLDLQGGSRVAQRVRLELPSGDGVWFYNTHLHHERDAGAMREEQARLIVEWMAAHEQTARVLVGDLNARPDDPPVRLIAERLRSAYAAVHGREPDATAPTPLSEHWGTRSHVIDYIFVSDEVEVRDARLTFDRTDPADPRLSASDHYGLAADVSVRTRPD